MANGNTRQKLLKVVFLDRDGVINRDSPDYVKSVSEFTFLPRSLDALVRLARHGFDLVVITNQSAVNRRMISLGDLDAIHSHLRNAVTAGGGRIRDIFFCPHRPDEECPCRKPRTGLIRQAQGRYAIDLHSAYLVGDSAKDIECARNAGCGHAILVQTGNGAEAKVLLAQSGKFPDYVAVDLHEAADWIIAHERSHAVSPE